MDTGSGVPLRYDLEILSNKEALPSLTPHALVADLFPYCLPEDEGKLFSMFYLKISGGENA